jgi:tape measure domain-containing protein
MADTTIDIKAKDKVSPVLKKIELEMAGFKRQVDSFSAGFHKMLSVGGGVGATAALANLVKGSLDAQIALQRLELSYKSVFGEGAAGQLQAIYEQTQRVGLEYTSTAEAAKSFFAAGQDSTLAPDMNRIFTSVTNAGAALQLSTEQMNGAFIAFGQMISKGKVQAEELRGQLGERLPGAFQMAAKAMGMTTAELDIARIFDQY